MMNALLDRFSERVKKDNLPVEGILWADHETIHREIRFTPDRPRVIYSHTKSFAATAAAFAIQEGKLHLDDKICRMFPEHIPDNMDARWYDVTVQDALTMSSGADVPLLAYDNKIVDGIPIAELNGARFTVIAGIFSILAVISYFACYYLVTERVVNESARERREDFGIKHLVVGSVKNRAIISIIVASILMLLSQFTLQQMANYIYPDYYANTAAQSASTFAMMLGMFVSAAGAKPLAERFGKAEISAASSVGAAVVCLLLFFVRPENVWIYVLFNLVSWLGLGVFSMVSWALITDVIDYSELKNGVREDGSIYSLYSFARKLGQAAAAGLSGLLLTAIGYEKIEGVPLSESVLDGIFNISTVLPAIGFAMLAAVLWFWYPLKKDVVLENSKRLAKKEEN